MSIGISVQLRTKQNCSVFHDFIALRSFPCFVDVNTFLNLGFVAANSCFLRARIHGDQTHHHKKCWSSYCWLWGLYRRSSPTYLPRPVGPLEGELWKRFPKSHVGGHWTHHGWCFPPKIFEENKELQMFPHYGCFHWNTFFSHDILSSLPVDQRHRSAP